MRESPATKYQKFIESKPTKQEYKSLENSLFFLLKTRCELNNTLTNIDKLISKTRKILNDYKNLV